MQYVVVSAPRHPEVRPPGVALLERSPSHRLPPVWRTSPPGTNLPSQHPLLPIRRMAVAEGLDPAQRACRALRRSQLRRRQLPRPRPRRLTCRPSRSWRWRGKPTFLATSTSQNGSSESQKRRAKTRSLSPRRAVTYGTPGTPLRSELRHARPLPGRGRRGTRPVLRKLIRLRADLSFRRLRLTHNRRDGQPTPRGFSARKQGNGWLLREPATLTASRLDER